MRLISRTELPISRHSTDQECFTHSGYRRSKRLLDIVLALIGLLLLSPLWLMIAVCIKIEDQGPVFYRRQIVGYQGQRFLAWKFRSMCIDAETYLLRRPELYQRYQRQMKLFNDPRVTHVGRYLRRWSLDELPQLLNVLQGEMTLVGPRMIHPDELPRYEPYVQKRLSVKPGITGLWQISGRQHFDYQERVQLDLLYIDQRSLRLDLWILSKTLGTILNNPGT